MKTLIKNLFHHPAACVALSLLLITPAWAAERQQLGGHVPAAAARSQPVGRLPGSSRLNLAIGLPLRNQPALTTLLEQLYDPASAQYRHYLSPEQFAERFGPAKQDYEALIGFAKAQGLAVTATHPNRTLLDVSGSVEDIDKVFHVTMRVYRHPTEARTFHAPDVEPSLDLAVSVLRINGLDDLNPPRPMAHRMPLDNNRKGKPLGGSGPGGGFLGYDFRAAYVPGVALTGAGQSVALFEAGGYYASDITDYESLAGLPNVPLQNVLMNGFDGTPDSYSDFEVSLDIEMAISMAPGLSQVIVYEGNNTPYNDILNRIATDNAAKQISSSWTLSFNATSDQIFKQYAAQGQSFFQASGDDGAYPGGWVADDPYIISVGGTELSTSGPGGAWVSETVWNLGYNLRAGTYNASGGGISPTYSIPSWQQGLSMAANHGSTTRRNSPDVAMVADNIWVLSDNGDSSAGWGTSASAPLWAGFTALANQLAQADGQPPVGFINPAIYALGRGASYNSAFHDITTGNNTTTASPTGFFAVSGYDLCTGWGTPNGSNLLSALALPQLLQVTPVTSFTASGPAGGPFSPTAQSYSLTNSGAAALNWTLAYAASWLEASATSGTLTPGAPETTVTLSLNTDATNLTAGSYAADVWFTNLNDGSAQSRLFTLAVVTPPVIITGPLDQTVPDGGTATFTVVAASNALLFYAWNRDTNSLTDGGRISGSANSTLTISNVSSTDAGTYTVSVTNIAGAAQSAATLLTVASPPVIVAPPTNQTVLPGATATFAVGAVGSQPLFYQWQNHGTNIISGGNTNVLMLRNVSPADAGAYSVVVNNALGSVTSGGGLLAVIPVTAPGITLATLHSFNGADGANPLAPLVQATNGSFYGTANSGGVSRAGTVFRITTNGVLSTLHAFSGGNDGGAPRAGLIQAADGNLYGTTYSGGTNGGGTVFRTTLGGGLTTLHAFGYGSDGGNPWGLVQATDGNFYGTTSSGGDSGDGTVFKMLPNGTLTRLHGFSGADGANPRGGLVQGNDGNLYGVTLRYGVASPYDGTCFKITTTGTLTTLFNGTGTNRFSPRDRLVQSSDGNFYGTTLDDGANRSGTVFRMTPTGLLTRLYSFTGGSDGQWPRAALVEGKDGNFYCTTSYGGGGFNGSEFSGQGTAFIVTPNGLLTTLLHFDGFNGANPSAPLVQATDGNFYGTTPNGGANGFGTVFRLSIPVLSILVQPLGQTNVSGSTVTFSVLASGRERLSYQWGKDGGAISGATNAFLILPNVQKGDEGLYSVVVSNTFGVAISSSATLYVDRPPVADASATVSPVISSNGSSAVVVLDGSRSSDPDGDALQYRWLSRLTPIATERIAVVVLPVGANPITLQVSDGLAADSNTLMVRVITTADALRNLMSLVNGVSLPRPTAEALPATLEAALAALDSGNTVVAINILGAFEAQVRAQIAPLDPALAATLFAAAEAILNKLNSALTSHPGRAAGSNVLVTRQTNGRVKLQFSADAAQVYIVEASYDLAHWEKLGVAAVAADGQLEFEDAESPGHSLRFYRVTLPVLPNLHDQINLAPGPSDNRFYPLTR